MERSEIRGRHFRLHYEVDGKVWTKTVGTREIFRVDLKIGDWEKFRPLDQLPGRQPLD